jgi:hypothetical protein
LALDEPSEESMQLEVGKKALIASDESIQVNSHLFEHCTYGLL